jgi:hypothetical protein
MKKRVIKVIRGGAAGVAPPGLSSKENLSRTKRKDARDITRIVKSWVDERRENKAEENDGLPSFRALFEDPMRPYPLTTSI